MLVRFLRRLSVVLVAVLMTAGCSGGSDLSPDQRVVARRAVEQRSTAASIELSDDDLNCVVDQMRVADLGDLESDRVDHVADVVVSCVGEDLIGRSLLRSQAGEIGDPSLDCAVRELDRRFVVDLVAGAMNGGAPEAPIEIELARVLSVCLELDELL